MWYYDSKNSDRWLCCRFQFRLRFPLRICLSSRLPTSMVSHTFCFVALFAQILHIRTVVAPKNNSQKNLNNLNIRYDSDLNSDCLTISIIIADALFCLISQMKFLCWCECECASVSVSDMVLAENHNLKCVKMHIKNL